jgi:hypothetical protein
MRLGVDRLGANHFYGTYLLFKLSSGCFFYLAEGRIGPGISWNMGNVFIVLGVQKTVLQVIIAPNKSFICYCFNLCFFVRPGAIE